MPRDSSGPDAPCRILYLIGELHRGGQERQLYCLLQAMDRTTYHPAVAVWNYVDSDFHVGLIRALGVPIHAIAGASSLGKLGAFRRLVRQLAPDVVHSYSFHTNFAVTWATVGTPAIAVGSIRSDFDWAKQGSGRVLGRLSARWPAFHIANSHAAAASARRSTSPFAPRRCDVVSNGIDLDRFRTRPIDLHSPTCIVGVGYLRPEKRWDRLLRASDALLRRHGADHRIRICGDGPDRSALQELASHLGIADRVTFVGHVDDVGVQMADATFGVLTSEREGCPNAVMETMACGRAVVATDVGDVGRILEHGRTGVIVPSGDHTTLVDGLALLARDRGLCVAMGDAARVKAWADFGLDRVVRQTLGAYRDAGWHDDVSASSSTGHLVAETRS